MKDPERKDVAQGPRPPFKILPVSILTARFPEIAEIFTPRVKPAPCASMSPVSLAPVRASGPRPVARDAGAVGGAGPHAAHVGVDCLLAQAFGIIFSTIYGSVAQIV